MNNHSTSKLNIDYTLIFIVFLLGLVSIFTLYSITPFLPPKYENINFMVRQAAWYIAGGGIVAVTMLVDYDRFKQLTWWLYAFGMALLLVIFFHFPSFLIYEANNAESWIKFPIIGTLQPAEIMKVFLVLAIAHVMVNHNNKYINRTIKTDLILLLKIAAVAAPPTMLIAIQPDLGGLLVMSAITGAMILVSGIQWRLLFTLMLIAFSGMGLIFAAWYFFPDTIGTFLEETVFNHVASRFYGWLNPEQYSDSGYQLILAMLAIGSGQLFGKGMQTMEVYVPERHTDMIFTAVAEQFGFIGASIVVTLFFLLIYRLIHIAIQSNDSYGSYLTTGFIGMFTYQIFQNIGMSIQLLPITGLPLPFLSYGGTSIMTYMLSIGIVLNVHSRTKKYMFES